MPCTPLKVKLYCGAAVTSAIQNTCLYRDNGGRKNQTRQKAVSVNLSAMNRIGEKWDIVALAIVKPTRQITATGFIYGIKCWRCLGDLSFTRQTLKNIGYTGDNIPDLRIIFPSVKSLYLFGQATGKIFIGDTSMQFWTERNYIIT